MSSQAIVEGASPEKALDDWLSAPDSRRADYDVLESYIMADKDQHGSSCSTPDLDDITAESSRSSRD